MPSFLEALSQNNNNRFYYCLNYDQKNYSNAALSRFGSWTVTNVFINKCFIYKPSGIDFSEAKAQNTLFLLKWLCTPYIFCEYSRLPLNEVSKMETLLISLIICGKSMRPPLNLKLLKQTIVLYLYI